METQVEFEEVKMKKPSLFGIIISPSIQFNRMKEKAPIGLPLVYMLLLLGITGALSGYLSTKNPIVIHSYETIGVKMNIATSVISGAIGGILGGTIMFFIIAAIYKIFMVFFGNDTTYKKLITIVIYTSVITYLGSIANCILALALGGYEAVYTSLIPLAGNNQTTLKAIAGSFNIFQIWHYVLLAMGLHIAAGLNKNKAITLVVIFFLLGIGFSYAMTLIPGLPKM